MCRSHRRCPSSSHRHRTRALNTANKRIERARAALRGARATGDPDAITAAEQRLTAAQANRTTVAAAHPLPQDRGHDMTDNDNTHRDNTDAQDTETIIVGGIHVTNTNTNTTGPRPDRTKKDSRTRSRRAERHDHDYDYDYENHNTADGHDHVHHQIGVQIGRDGSVWIGGRRIR
jgi:hypothetical protein